MKPHSFPPRRSSDLKTAAASAALGDTKDLLSMVRQVMADPEGAKLVERLNQTAPKQS